MTYALNWYYEVSLNSGLLAHDDDQFCLFYIYTVNGFGDILRALGFVLVLHFLTRHPHNMFPLPFTWIFKDLSKFILEPYCIKVFRRYLKEEESDKLEYLDEIMRIYLNSFRRSTTNSRYGSTNQTSEVGTFLMNGSESTSK